MSRPVICLEFNELTHRLMDTFIEQGKLPNFERLRKESTVAITDAAAEGEWLNPWVQWVSVHSGLTPVEHGVFRLSNAFQLQQPAIWDLASAGGRRVWICGSMNPWYSSPINGHVLPDAWCQKVAPYPAGEFEAFYNYLQKNVQEYAATNSPLSRQETVRFVTFMAGHGLRLATVFKIVRQLIRERRGNHRWRRASLLDDLQFDVFAHYYKKYQPAFSTFFINSTAHYQHKFWRNMEPEKFLLQPTEQEQHDYRDAVLFGYQEMDALIGRFLRLAPQAVFVFMSGLGQQPYLKMEGTGGKRFFRLHGKHVLVDKLHLRGDFSYEPLMADEFILRYHDATQAEDASQRLRSYKLPTGEAAFSVDTQGKDLVCQCRCRSIPDETACLTNSEGGTVPFYEVYYHVDSLKSGFHHREGMLWIRHPDQAARVVDHMVPLTAIAPLLLSLLDVPIPAHLANRHDPTLSGTPAANPPARELAVAVA